MLFRSGVLSSVSGTLWVSLFAILFALPFGLSVSIYMSEVANPKVRNWLKPIIELLSGIPSVVYGFFGLIVIVPLIQKFFDLPVGESGLAELKRELDRESYNNSISSYHKSLYDRRKEQGLCPVCGKTNKEKRYVTCNNCRNKKNSRTKPKTLKDEREKGGLCIWCDRPVKDGYKICEIHYQMNCEKAKKANRDYLRKSNKALFIKY